MRKSFALSFLLPALALAQTGDSKCNRLMCIDAVVNGTTVTYQMRSTGNSQLGWMAMGFGTSMASPMVIMWPNSDGTTTLSQRITTGNNPPTVVGQPARVATLSNVLTVASGNTPSLGFEMQHNSETSQNIVWAFSTAAPSSSAVDADIQQHVEAGRFTAFDLTKVLATTPSNGTTPNTPTSGGGSDTVIEPLKKYQKMLIAHAILTVIGFLFLLPTGVLLARYFRTSSPRWYTGHWIVQFAFAGPIIIVGIALGFASVNEVKVAHMSTTHAKAGAALLIIYLVQCALGAIIHFWKPSRAGRPPQNYAHAVLGLTTICLSFWQVRTGYKNEWPRFTGQAKLTRGVDIVWTIWIVLMPLLYIAGLYLLKKQFAQEKQHKANKEQSELKEMGSHTQ